MPVPTHPLVLLLVVEGQPIQHQKSHQDAAAGIHHRKMTLHVTAQNERLVLFLVAALRHPDGHHQLVVCGGL